MTETILKTEARPRTYWEPAVDPVPLELPLWIGKRRAPTLVAMVAEAAIRAGLPEPGGFGRPDLRWCGTDLEVSP